MFAIAIHGGAGTINKNLINQELQTAYETALSNALQSGYAVLEKQGSSLDAVSAAITALEDCPLFNAGKGAVFNHDGFHEMDASIMRGADRAAGAVSGVRNIKNPILLARKIMEASEHVYLSGSGAEFFAKEQGLNFEEEAYFFDQFRFDQFQEALKSDVVQLDHASSGDKKFSTVGAVALDVHGDLCAGTSTGGMTNKKFGRVGDTPIIGAGTYANNSSCAVSCTGHGELFIRQVVAHQIHCLMEYKSLSLEEACLQVVMEDLVEIKGEGGLIAIDIKGNITLPFNSEGMYRGFQKSDGERFVGIY